MFPGARYGAARPAATVRETNGLGGLDFCRPAPFVLA